MKCYPEIKEKEEMRKIIGRYGLTGKQQVSGLGWEDPRQLGHTGWASVFSSALGGYRLEL